MQTELNDNQLQRGNALETKLKRVGILHNGLSSADDKRKYRTRYNKLTEEMMRIMGKPHRMPERVADADPDDAHDDPLPPDYEDIINSDPKPHPSPVSMSEDAIKKTIAASRRFGVSMQLFDCKACSCCGLTSPTHCDPDFPHDTECPFPRKHLKLDFKPAWRCNCEICNLGIYWPTGRPRLMEQYAPNHHGKHPWEVMTNEQEGIPNAQLCPRCYKEKSIKPGELERELSVTNEVCFCANCSTNIYFMMGFLTLPIK